MQSIVNPLTKEHESNRLCILRDKILKNEYLVCIISNTGEFTNFKMVDEAFEERKMKQELVNTEFALTEIRNRWFIGGIETLSGKYRSIHLLIEWNAFIILDDGTLSSMTLIGGVINVTSDLINTVDTSSGLPFIIDDIAYFSQTFMFTTESKKLYGHNPYGRMIASGDWVDSRDPVLVETLPESFGGDIKKFIDLGHLIMVIDNKGTVYYQELFDDSTISVISKMDYAISKALRGNLPQSDELYEHCKHIQDDTAETPYNVKVQTVRGMFSEILGNHFKKLEWKAMFDNQTISDVFRCNPNYIILVTHDLQQFLVKMDCFPLRQPIVSDLSNVSSGLSIISKVRKSDSHEIFFIDIKGKLWRINIIDDKSIIEGFNINVRFVDLFPNYTGLVQASVILIDEHGDLWHFTTFKSKFECNKLKTAFECMRELSNSTPL